MKKILIILVLLFSLSPVESMAQRGGHIGKPKRIPEKKYKPVMFKPGNSPEPTHGIESDDSDKSGLYEILIGLGVVAIVVAGYCVWYFVLDDRDSNYSRGSEITNSPRNILFENQFRELCSCLYGVGSDMKCQNGEMKCFNLSYKVGDSCIRLSLDDKWSPTLPDGHNLTNDTIQKWEEELAGSFSYMSSGKKPRIVWYGPYRGPFITYDVQENEEKGNVKYVYDTCKEFANTHFCHVVRKKYFSEIDQSTQLQIIKDVEPLIEKVFADKTDVQCNINWIRNEVVVDTSSCIARMFHISKKKKSEIKKQDELIVSIMGDGATLEVKGELMKVLNPEIEVKV